MESAAATPSVGFADTSPRGEDLLARAGKPA